MFEQQQQNMLKQFWTTPAGTVFGHLLQNNLQNKNFCCIGGLALLIHGVPRMPQDLDLLLGKNETIPMDSNEFEIENSQLDYAKWRSKRYPKVSIDWLREGMV